MKTRKSAFRVPESAYENIDSMSPSNILRTMNEELTKIKDAGRFPGDKRRGVLRNTKAKKGGFVLGSTATFTGTMAVAKGSRLFPYLSWLVAAYAAKKFPDFPYQTVQVNEGASGLHVDGNCGESIILSFGDYEGGKLWAMKQSDGKMTWAIRNIDPLKGGKVLKFDGNLPHMTLPITSGTRYSLVYFSRNNDRKKQRGLRGLSQVDHRFLVDQGYPAKSIPTSRTSARLSKCTPRRSDLLPKAAEILKGLGYSRAVIGDYTNKSIASRRSPAPQQYI